MVELVKHTKPNQGIGLATFVLEVPAYIWMELLTHKRFARNASSARAQSFNRHKAHGFYIAPQYYTKGSWMQPGKPLPDYINNRVRDRIESLYAYVLREVEAIQDEAGIAIANEQINRLLPISRMMRGVMTGTEEAWFALINLRKALTADILMQQVATEIESLLLNSVPEDLDIHIPFAPEVEDVPFQDVVLAAAARLARVSAGAPGPGQRSDLQLAEHLVKEKHWSPFEHIAVWTPDPQPSALCSVEREDTVYWSDDGKWGWENYRVLLQAEEQV